MLNSKDMRKLVVPLAALIVLAFQHFAHVEIDQTVVENVLDGILMILIALGIFQNPDKQPNDQ